MCAIAVMNYGLMVYVFLAVDGVAAVVVEVKEAVHVAAVGKCRIMLR
jgi:hypothetical protein